MSRCRAAKLGAFKTYDPPQKKKKKKKEKKEKKMPIFEADL